MTTQLESNLISKGKGTNDYNFLFIKEFLELLKCDVLRLLKEFHRHGVLPRGTNLSFVTLIVKCDNPQNLG